VLGRLRATGGQVTTARRLLLRSLFGSPRHRTAEDLTAEIQPEAPDVHISTVYRNLEELERLGVVTHAHLGHGPATCTSPRRHTAISSAKNAGRCSR
jgi:Fur family ferric uptake transcriptional regulator